MPYISNNDREFLTRYDFIEANSRRIQAVPSGKVKGALNYILCRLTMQTMKPAIGWSYTSLSDAVSVLRDAADEIERRMMTPYEDKAILKNGDLPEFE